MIENVKERVKGLRGSSPLLDIIHDEHIDALVEADEVVHRIPTGGIGKLHLEQTGRDIKYAPAWVHLFTTHANGIDEVRLATSRGSIDKEGVEGRLARMLSNSHADSARQLVGITLDETLEGLVQVELRIKVLRSNSIENRWRLVDTLTCYGSIDGNSLATLFVDSQLVLLINDDAIVQLHIIAKTTTQHLAQQVDVVLLQILIHIPARYLYEESPAVFVIFLEDDWREPCSELLLRDVVLDDLKAVVPKRLWIHFHAAIAVFLISYTNVVKNDFDCKGRHFF